MIECCNTCAFGRVKFGATLSCHKRPPIVFNGVVRQEHQVVGPLATVRDVMGAVTAWPEVVSTDFCGEWELKDAT